MLSNALTIARREFSAYFNSPIAYIVIVVFLVLTSALFFAQLFLSGEADLRPYFNLAPLLFTFFAPATTMALFAEEKQNGTLEMLLTFPLTDWQVVLGKFLGAFALGCVMILLTTPFALFVAAYGPLDKGPAIGGFIGLLLMFGGYQAIGLMASIWTKNQVVGYILGVLFCFLLFISGKVLQLLPRGVSQVVEKVSSDYHFQSIARGVVDVRDLIYYASLIGISLIIAQASLESRRWR